MVLSQHWLEKLKVQNIITLPSRVLNQQSLIFFNIHKVCLQKNGFEQQTKQNFNEGKVTPKLLK